MCVRSKMVQKIKNKYKKCDWGARGYEGFSQGPTWLKFFNKTLPLHLDIKVKAVFFRNEIIK